MVGGTTLGYWATGRAYSATAPISTMTIASTFARTGRSMKNLEIMARPRSRLVGRDRCFLRRDLIAGDRALQAGDHHLILGLQAGFNDPQHTHLCAHGHA